MGAHLEALRRLLLEDRVTSQDILDKKGLFSVMRDPIVIYSETGPDEFSKSYNGFQDPALITNEQIDLSLQIFYDKQPVWPMEFQNHFTIVYYQDAGYGVNTFFDLGEGYTFLIGAVEYDEKALEFSPTLYSAHMVIDNILSEVKMTPNQTENFIHIFHNNFLDAAIVSRVYSNPEEKNYSIFDMIQNWSKN